MMFQLNKSSKTNGKAHPGFSVYRRHIAGLVLSSAIVVASSFGSGIAAPVVGTSAAVRGNVYVSTAGAERKAQVKDAIKLQDKVLTKQDSALQILLLDQSTFTVGQNCELTIDLFVYDPDTSVGDFSATVAKGAFRFISGAIGKNNPENASIRTPIATIGIRGTMFEGIVGPDAIALAQLGGLDTSGAHPTGASIIILRGPGRSRNSLDRTGIIDISTNGGTETINQPNYFVFAPGPNQPPSKPMRITPEMQAYLDFFLRSHPSGAGENPTGVETTGSQESGQEVFELPQPSGNNMIEELEDAILDPNVDKCCSTPYTYLTY